MKLRQFPDSTTFKKQAETANVIPVCMEILADTETPVSLLKKIYRRKGPVFLLESVEGGERWGRYSFIGISAKSLIRVFQDKIEFEENGRVDVQTHRGEPLSALRHYMAGYRPAHVPELPRFWGGLVGYFTYEMVSFFEKIPNRLPAETPLARFCLPDEVLIFDNVKNTLIIVVTAYLTGEDDPESVYRERSRRVSAIYDLILQQTTMDPLAPDVNKKAPGFMSLISESDYKNRVKTTKDHIRNGDIIQAVISQPFASSRCPDPVALYRAQRYINPSPYMFFLHLDDMLLVGSSPETMVRLENNLATIRPIAGTRPRGETEKEDRVRADELLKDEKERAEHLMLVDLGRNDLGRVARTGTVQVTDLMVVERYSHVMHLVSNVTCNLASGYDAWDLLAATFPAGTLSGAPKVRAMEIIADLETRPRGVYGGAVGYVSFSGNMDLAITIRTAAIENGVLTVRAGAGIVADSDPDSEHLETINKARSVERALMLAENAERIRI